MKPQEIAAALGAEPMSDPQKQDFLTRFEAACDDEIDSNHPDVWYDDEHSGLWWGQGHISMEDLTEGALEYDGCFDARNYKVEHCWRSDCIDGRFNTAKHQSADYPHPVTRLI